MAVTRIGRITFWTTTGFVLLQLGWLLVMPPFTGSDEFDHANRAISVAEGHWYNMPHLAPFITGRGDLIESREDIVTAANPACSRLRYTGPYNCRPERDLPGDEVVVASAAARYNPTFYALVGFAAKPFHGNAALYVMRFVAAAVCAALFALSVRMTATWADTRWPLVALALAALPTTIYSTIVAAPNGIEMMAGLALWAALLHRTRVMDRPLWAYATLGLSAVLLVNMHTLGALWLALIIGAAAVLVGIRALFTSLWPRSVFEWLVLAVSGSLTAFAVVWVKAARTNDPSDFPAVVKDSVWPLMPRQMILWPLQAIGAFPLRDQPAPEIVYAIGAPMLLLLAAVAIRAVRRNHDQPTARTMAMVAVASFLVPAVLTAASFSRFGLTWQGRYGMPFTVGLILLYGFALDRAGTGLPRIVVDIGLVAWLLTQAISQLGVLEQQESDSRLVDATGWWAPPPAVLIALALGTWWTWRRALSQRTETATPAKETTKVITT